MAKRKSTTKPTKKTVAKKSAARATKKTAKKKPSAKKAVAAVKRATRKSKATPRKTVKSKAAPSLGRPQVTAEEKLYLLFREDYHARQIFEFLRVETVGELEQYSPKEIVHRLSQPIRNTVQRIREKLAEKNRSLNEDQTFAIEYQQRRRG